MSYVLSPEKSLDAEVRRVALEQIEKACKALEEIADDPHEAIHDARKVFKKLRGLIRLVKPELKDFYKAQNALFRDTARDLSGTRDKAALVEAMEKLEARFETEPGASDVLTPVWTRLIAERDEAIEAGAGDLPHQIETAFSALAAAKANIETCRFDERARYRPKRDARILASGLATTYGRAFEALKTASASRSAHDLHELRKRVKYHWMHLRLAKPLWPAEFAARIALAKEISDDLGDDHDLAVLTETIAREPEAFGTPEALVEVSALIERRQAELREVGLASARVLLCERPKAMERRVRNLHHLASGRAHQRIELPGTKPKA
ncbi:CHAD domain-containing protein [Fulvimarina endophytica]|uniref:CHAD domain-containing protein n=1 Tax=Fulvimarina endophytica TaxID=2293836 RepID=A0A371X815_9HYPH|nr:CHAD domain-containing protein [Fulvimarina endophytica]RFC65338.1 CHAD domain-containing protein [Fulvimarina endophytica]